MTGRLILLVGLAALALFWRVSTLEVDPLVGEAPPPVDATAEQTGGAPLVARAAPRPGNWRALVERPLFTEGRLPPDAGPSEEEAQAPEETAPAEEPLPQWRLIGIATVGGAPIGLLMPPGADRAVRVRVGEAVEGWTVRAIDAGRVTLDALDGAELVLAFDEEDAG